MSVEATASNASSSEPPRMLSAGCAMAGGVKPDPAGPTVAPASPDLVDPGDASPGLESDHTVVDSDSDSDDAVDVFEVDADDDADDTQVTLTPAHEVQIASTMQACMEVEEAQKAINSEREAVKAAVTGMKDAMTAVRNFKDQRDKAMAYEHIAALKRDAAESVITEIRHRLTGISLERFDREVKDRLKKHRLEQEAAAEKRRLKLEAAAEKRRARKATAGKHTAGKSRERAIPPKLTA